MQEGGGEGPVTDQWLPPFVVVDEQDKAVGTVEVRAHPDAQSATPQPR